MLAAEEASKKRLSWRAIKIVAKLGVMWVHVDTRWVLKNADEKEVGDEVDVLRVVFGPDINLNADNMAVFKSFVNVVADAC